MIRRPRLWRKIDLQIYQTQPLPYPKARRLFDALYREARTLGLFRTRTEINPATLRLAKALNQLARS